MAKTTYSREELERQLSESRREFLAADVTINNLELKLAKMAARLANEENKCAALAAENAEMRSSIDATIGWQESTAPENVESVRMLFDIKTPATDAFLAEVRAQGVEMYADNLDNAAEDAERGGFDYDVKFLRSEASSVRLFADQLRKGGNQ